MAVVSTLLDQSRCVLEQEVVLWRTCFSNKEIKQEQQLVGRTYSKAILCQVLLLHYFIPFSSFQFHLNGAATIALSKSYIWHTVEIM